MTLVSSSEIVASIFGLNGDWHDQRERILCSGVLENPAETVPLLIAGIRARFGAQPPNVGRSLRGISFGLNILREMGPQRVSDSTVVLDALRELIDQGKADSYLVEEAVDAIRVFPDPAATPMLLEVLLESADSPSGHANRQAAVQALLAIDAELVEVFPQLYRWLESESHDERQVAAWVFHRLATLSPSAPVDTAALERATNLEDGITALHSAATLVRLKRPGAIALLVGVGNRFQAADVSQLVIAVLSEVAVSELDYQAALFISRAVFAADEMVSSDSLALLRKIGVVRMGKLTGGQNFWADMQQ